MLNVGLLINDIFNEINQSRCGLIVINHDWSKSTFQISYIAEYENR